MKKKFLLLATLCACSAFTLGFAACDLTNNANSSSGAESSSSAEKVSKGLSYELLEDDTYEVSGLGDCADTEIVIPSTYNDKAVTSIGANAFFFCENVTSVVIGNSITSISKNAFCGCSELTSVTIGDGVTSIDENAFSDCSELTSVTIGDSVTSIAHSAFMDCESLEQINIPESVTSIGNNAFYGCESLKDVYISSIEAWCKISFKNDEATPFSYARNLYVNGEAVYEIEIPESITSIGNFVFRGMRNLTRISIPTSVTSIGEYSFFDCASLTIYCEAKNQPSDWQSDWYGFCPVVWDCKNNEVAADGYVYGIVEGLRYALKDGEAMVARQQAIIKTAIIPENVAYKGKQYRITSLDEAAFSRCEDFEYSEYGNAKYVGSETNDYFALVEANINSFEYDIHSDTKIIANSAFQWCHNLTNLGIPDGVIYIGDYAFSQCDGLCDLTIPESVKVIGKYAFYLCSLGKLTIPDGVTTIKEYAFYYCGNLTNVTIGNDVTSIGDYAFLDCEELTSVTIGSGVVSIGDYAFSGCARLTNLAIGASVASIGEGAFYRCIELTSIIIPDGVTSIGKEAFYLCYKVASLVIPESITFIGDSAFYGCGEKTNVYYGGLAEAWRDLQSGCPNTYLTSANIYFYIEKEEDVPTDGGNYWHYGENGEMVIWEK